MVEYDAGLYLVGYRALSDDSLRKKVFDDYLTHLLHKAKDKERKREKEDKVSFYLEVFVISIVYIDFRISCSVENRNSGMIVSC